MADLSISLSERKKEKNARQNTTVKNSRVTPCIFILKLLRIVAYGRTNLLFLKKKHTVLKHGKRSCLHFPNGLLTAGVYPVSTNGVLLQYFPLAGMFVCRRFIQRYPLIFLGRVRLSDTELSVFPPLYDIATSARARRNSPHSIYISTCKTVQNDSFLRCLRESCSFFVKLNSRGTTEKCPISLVQSEIVRLRRLLRQLMSSNDRPFAGYVTWYKIRQHTGTQTAHWDIQNKATYM